MAFDSYRSHRRRKKTLIERLLSKSKTGRAALRKANKEARKR
jgi:hypothetical protein